jgi:hypothetical protein
MSSLSDRRNDIFLSFHSSEELWELEEVGGGK